MLISQALHFSKVLVPIKELSKFKVIGRSIRYNFSDYLDFSEKILQVSKTGSHISKKQIFSKYFQGQSQQTRQSIANIFRFIEQKPKTGVATKSLCKHLIQKYQIKDCKENDIDFIACAIAQSLKSDRQAFSPKEENAQQLSIFQIEQILNELINKVGKGSHLYKLNHISQFIQKMNSQSEIIVLLRIITKKLRMGATEKLIKIQHHNQKSTISNTQEKDTRSSTTQYGFELMLAKPLRNLQQLQKFCSKKESQTLLADTKHDGQRSLIKFKRGLPLEMISRRKKSQVETYTPFAQKILEELTQLSNIQSITLDGQIVCVGQNYEPLPMQRLLNQRGKLQFSEDDNTKMVYYSFDVLEYNGEQFFQKSLQDRLKFIPETDTIKQSKAQIFKWPDQKENLLAYFSKVLSQKYEGLIIKGIHDKYYMNGSRKHWGKLKKGCRIYQVDSQQIDIDLVVMGVDYGQGKRQNYFATFLLGVYDQGFYYPISKVGSGFTEVQMQEFTASFKQYILNQKPQNYIVSKFVKPSYYLSPQIVFEVTCQQVTRSSVYDFNFKQGYGGISLRFPVFRCVRQDKSPEDCDGYQLLQLGNQNQ